MAQELTSNRKKILCLHGNAQNADIFQQKLGGLKRAFKDFDLIFVNAPHKLHNDGGEEDKRQWWNTNPKFGAVGDGWEKSLLYLQNVFETQGPFCGIFGFSQGGDVGVTLAALQQEEDSQQQQQQQRFCPGLNRDVFRFGFLITISSKIAQFEVMQSLVSRCRPISCVNALIIWGKTDQIIPAEYSEQLCQCFSKVTRYTHEKGHMIPTDASGRNTIKEFLDNLI